MRARAHADDRSERFTVLEQDHGRDRQHVVAGTEPGLVVDVHPRDGDGKLLEDRLERLARAAPGRPEVHEQRPARDRVVERPPVELGHSRPANAANRSVGTFHTASNTIARLIFDRPALRSAKRIGTSTTWNPLRSVRYVVSIWNTYPAASIVSRSIDSSTRRRKHLKPPVESWIGIRRTRVYTEAPREMSRRTSPQFSVPPPST